jgi:hypothetical protein
MIPPKYRFWADPHIIQHESRYYIAHGTVELYRCMSFPDEWAFVMKVDYMLLVEFFRRQR